MSVHPFNQVVADSERVRHDRERRIHGGAGRKETSVDDVEVVNFVSFAIDVQSGGLRIPPKANRPVLMRHTGKRYAITHEQIAREDTLMTFMAMDRASSLLLHKPFQFHVETLVTFLVVLRVLQDD